MTWQVHLRIFGFGAMPYADLLNRVLRASPSLALRQPPKPPEIALT